MVGGDVIRLGCDWLLCRGWTEEEDEALRRAIARSGDKNWNAGM